ncbi:unnamed protein product [Meganyctiphanes norvegica]|uniref:RING-type domain-containing protein n=1 Tax=Meganyctiphanes norvegica TaxID=48144 RepID=A0AAV2QSD7_MEGNR
MEFLECRVCHVPYNEGDHRPRHAPCGHGLCTACIGALIKDGIYECPTCRQKNKVVTADDLQVNYDLIEVIRGFKTKNDPMPKETESIVSGATNEEVCDIHCKALGLWCLKCQYFICEDCVEFHSSLTGCSTAIATNMMEDMKCKPLENIDILLSNFEMNAKYASSNIQEETDERNELLERAKRRTKELQETAVRQEKELLDKAKRERKDLEEEAERLRRELLEKAERQEKELLERAAREKKEILERAERQENELFESAKKHDEKVKKLRIFLDEGKIHKENLLKLKQQLKSANTPSTVKDGIRMVNQRKLMLQNMTVKLLGTNTALELTEALVEYKDRYAEMIIKDEKRHAKVSKHEGKSHLHAFLKQKVSDGCICRPFDHFQKMFPIEAPLVFVDLSLGDTVQGRVYIRLHKEVPNIRENVVQIFTGQRGPSLRGVKFDSCNSDCLATADLPFSEVPVTRDSNGRGIAKRGDVLGYFGHGYLRLIYFQVSASCNYPSDWCVFGHVEADGMDVIQTCYDKYSPNNVTISDCGLVLEQE